MGIEYHRFPNWSLGERVIGTLWCGLESRFQGRQMRYSLSKGWENFDGCPNFPT